MKYLKLVNVSENVTNIVQKSMTTWKMKVTASRQALEEVEIKREIFQGNRLSPLIFVFYMIPLYSLLRERKAGYMIDSVKTNNLLFIIYDIFLFWMT